MDISENELTGKVVLEVGTGRGDTTRKLAELLSHFPNSHLISTDISDQFFEALRGDLVNYSEKIDFIKTNCTKLEGIKPGSVDFIICNYTLCAVDAQAGNAVIALTRFYDVIRIGGKLYIEEEMPIETARNPAQEIWAEKWRILKTVEIATKKYPFIEFYPDAMVEMCRIAGFSTIQYTEDRSIFSGDHFLDFFYQRLEKRLPALPNEELRIGFLNWARNLQEKASQIGFMEVPIYRLEARKSAPTGQTQMIASRLRRKMSRDK